jgi:transcriptional regulator GlxA family with amidase domain
MFTLTAVTYYFLIFSIDKMRVGVLLFEDFETLDVFGPVEILGRLSDHYQIGFYSLSGGIVKNSHGVSVVAEKIEDISGGTDIFLIPGGIGTRKEVNNTVLIEVIKRVAEMSKYILTVCTGSALLAKTGLLDNRIATTNKRAFDWVVTNGDKVRWVEKARWTVDGNIYTSAGVSAGMDMTLGFLSDIHGLEFARTVAFQIEYKWQKDKNNDNFSKS